jgi:hypothetical protein
MVEFMTEPSASCLYCFWPRRTGRTWSKLPAEARAALTSLMTQLILGHAATTAMPRTNEISHDL